MPKVRVVKIIFDTELRVHEIPKFRGAVIDMVGSEHVSFHNHLGDSKYHYAYPVVQYKTHGRKAGIVCIEDGVEDIHHFFSKNAGSIKIGDQERELHVSSVKINKFEVQVWDSLFKYEIKNWIPFNENNYQKFKKVEFEVDKIHFMENILIGNILSFAKGINWKINKNIIVKISEIKNSYWINYKGVKLKSFHFTFKTNVFLPYDIGLGKGSSIGFGTLFKYSSNKKLNRRE
ncbi:CRISPR-associated endonuclease Cas6 [Pleomorphovibrio marinus]|uniref:CRISPR-associated endonuclease Cas6 n=1 Tax=Pleomorphovibrio marinus TaxID=2164132 RepID=UPI000E0BC928|nr:CRISPR-associated endonuclease Cas6 [Pleomorphovibrio marinus]